MLSRVGRVSTSAEIHAFFPSLVYGLVENKGGEKGAMLLKSYSARLRRLKTRAGKKAQGGGKRLESPLMLSSYEVFGTLHCSEGFRACSDEF